MKDIMAIYRCSFDRIVKYERDKRDFFEIFYHHFMKQSSEIRNNFRNTDFEHQKTVLKNSLVHMQTYYETRKAGEYLQRLARSHGHAGLDIRREMYDQWLEAFLETLKECDAEYSAEVGRAWREVLMLGIEFMRACSR